MTISGLSEHAVKIRCWPTVERRRSVLPAGQLLERAKWSADGHRICVHPFRGLLVGMPQKDVLCLHVHMHLYIGSPCPHSRGHSLLATRKNMVLILSNFGKVMSSNIMKAYRGNRGIALHILNLNITWTCVVSLIIWLLGPTERAVVPTEYDCGPKGWSECFRAQKNLLPLLCFETSYTPACRFVTLKIMLSWLHNSYEATDVWNSR